MPKQRTIKTPVTVSGVGLHTGEKVSLTFKPAPENHWYKFQRIDLPDKPIIEADADNVISTNHGTHFRTKWGTCAYNRTCISSLSGVRDR
jgi:UDP-3-O-[3-hydroxymyristoyl] N-acetylglucosamine deacetylase/3-hydroxyacyl-[acyl-carrier-protein] dehydratase